MKRIDRIAVAALEYADGDILMSAVLGTRQALYGWVRGRLYQLYPGGRCIDYTDVVSKTHIRYAKDGP